MSLTSLSLTELGALLAKKEAKAEEVVLSYLKKIEEKERDFGFYHRPRRTGFSPG